MIVVIADDLSGAAELANVALQAGLSADVQLQFDATSDADVVCISTDTRSGDAPHAAAVIEEVARAVSAASPGFIYKKCDSLLRGWVAEEALALARVLGHKRILIVPANPSRHRVIHDGTYFIGDTPLADSVVADDPDHPRRSSRIADLVDVAHGIEIPNVTSLDDVRRHALSVDEDTLPVGAADFFAALLDIRGLSPRLRRDIPESTGTSLYLCGSKAAQLARGNSQFDRHGIPIVAMPDEILRQHVAPAVLAQWAAAVTRVLHDHGKALMTTIVDEPEPGVTTAMLTERFAEAAALVVQDQSVGRVLVEGGNTATAVVQRLGFAQFRARLSPGPGVGALCPMRRSTVMFLVKPGSYVWPESVF
jgi:uncharacterized protein YgbK (DUF1537 family)